MQCSLPPPLTEDELSDVLDDIADVAVHRHLDQCAYCSARLEEARRIEHSLHRQLHRWDAPSADELADYVMGLIDAPARDRIEAYLRTSPATREEVTQTQAYLDIDALSANVVEQKPERRRSWHGLPRLEEIIATLIPQSLQPALRGDGGIARGELTAEGRGVTVFVEYVVEGETCTMTGQVMTSDPQIWSGALAQLFAEGNLVSSALLDPAGDFKVTGIAPGTYDLRIASEHHKVIVVHELRIDL